MNPIVLRGTGDVPDVPVFDFSGAPVPSLIQVALILVIPLLVGLVSDRLSSGLLKVTLHGGLAFVTAVLNGLLAASLAHAGFDWANALGNGLITWLLGIAAYRGIWRPSGAAKKLQDVPTLQLFGAKKGRHEA